MYDEELHKLVQDRHHLGKSYLVYNSMRDPRYPYLERHLLLVGTEGYENPDADVAVMLEYDKQQAPVASMCFLWRDCIWNGELCPVDVLAQRQPPAVIMRLYEGLEGRLPGELSLSALILNYICELGDL